ncbi:hypothetical protein HBH98_084480 [Parastagonospora nodorum]|nr:hypothetical protein HBH98_084480 [Parastagonospora nodorum]KAH4360679.1 hypothetical protein HBH97_203680 [Parastagonospora nodorum]KAH4407548.1 hypothetical protein HBH99_077710 [Parastagonospora nodorum]KAH5064036.1 hypothetical protein HBH95_215080 [Parastagonospora nodorum]KAH5156400.1 hypothetical protein HBH69_094020 [Parastagonospora nodorum]
MKFNIVYFMLPLVVMGALHNHAQVHKRGALANRAVLTEVVTVTEIQTVTVDADGTTMAKVESASESKIESTSSAMSESKSSSAIIPTSSSTSTATTTPSASGSVSDTPYPTLIPIPGSAILKNSCGYPVYIWSMGNPSCEGPEAVAKLIPANGQHVEEMRRCTDGGVAFKLSRTASSAKPMQFEYTIWSDRKTVSYDISYLDCMKNTSGEQDLSECAGHDGGIQAAGGEDCPDYQCFANRWCDQQAYVVAEFGYKSGAPVGGCTVQKGIAFELCASNRAN